MVNDKWLMIDMRENIIKLKSFAFAVRVVKLYKFLTTDRKEFVLSKQLLRSGTAVGALVREAEHAETKKDFIHKMAIAQKEINETIRSEEHTSELQSRPHLVCRLLLEKKKKKKKKIKKKKKKKNKKKKNKKQEYKNMKN